jgi:hypothetical protein
LRGGIQITNGIKVLSADHTEVEHHTGTLATHMTDGKPVLLTAWHVATANGATYGESIFQPDSEITEDTGEGRGEGSSGLLVDLLVDTPMPAQE